ncbi:MAG: hypothetical protein A3K03_12260, partial [Bdellovibrionales bacterium RIFOXYD1_FULL_44_7]
MAGLFQRLFKIGEAEGHSVLDQLENPVKMTEQGIRDLEKHYVQAIKDLAEVKAQVNKQRAELQKAETESADYEEKAMLLLSRAKSGQMDPAQAEDLARRALAHKAEAQKRIQLYGSGLSQQTEVVNRMQGQVDRIKGQIDQYKNELKTLQARSSAAKAATRLDKQLAGADPKGTVEMLERMRQKVEDQEALSAAYADLADRPKSLDEEIQRALGSADQPPKLLN